MGEGLSSRRRFLLGLGTLTAAATLPGATPVNADHPTRVFMSEIEQPLEKRRAGRRRPNFVLIVADDLGYGQVGSYGQRKIRTPRIDQMAQEGLRFTDAYAAAPVCAPARASLMTGLHVGHSPVRRNPPKTGDLPLPANVPTLGTVLKQAGYRTGVFGKWGFGGQMPNPSHPFQHGFDEFYGYLTHHSAKSYYPERLWDGTRPDPLRGNGEERGPHYGPDLIMERALDFMGTDGDDPFLLLLTLPLPHSRTTEPSGDNPYAAKDWNEADKVHAAQITRLDTYVGRILDTLAERGLAEDTIVLFTADNGPHEEGGVRPDFFNATGPYRGYKRNLYEGGLRVPFIAWSPKIMAGTRGKSTPHRTVHYDLLATFADFAGTDAPRGTDGLSLRPVLTGRGNQRSHDYLYWARLYAGATPSHRAVDRGRGRNAAAAVRFGRWKAVGFAPGQEYSRPGPKWDIELYDLTADPGETKDLAKQHPEAVRQALKHMRAAWRPLVSWRLIS